MAQYNQFGILIVLLLQGVGYILSLRIGGVRAPCGVSTNGGLGEPQPLLLKPGVGGDSNAFYYPDSSGIVSFTEGQAVNLACPGGTLLQGSTNTGETNVKVTCVSGTTFDINGNTVNFDTLTCSSYPFHTARYTGNTCVNNYKEIEIGFDVGSSFIQVIIICFDDVLQNSVYSQFNTTSGIGGYQSRFPRPSFIEDDFYNVGSNSVDDLYSRDGQRATINGILGLSSGDTQYVQSSGDYFMSRGHLTAKADFVYGSQHRATFHFVNVAPQWQTFNGGNWKRLELDYRAFASDRSLDLIVYTGGHGVTTLPDVNGVDQELYIYVDSNNNVGLPVPQFFWKVLYDPSTKAGIAFVGVNNPYHDDLQEGNFCTNVCDQVTWLNWDATDQKLGYSYCCAVDDLRNTVTTVPQFQVDSLLV